MLIEGRVEGEIHGTRVTVGESGDVQARIEAQVLTVRGTVRGECQGSKKVEITATGKVFGNIASRAIVVAEGATFRGASKMAQLEPSKPEERREPAHETDSPPARAEAENLSSTTKSASGT
jgi:cytoskeletal protein CcmA (bactofilin family)